MKHFLLIYAFGVCLLVGALMDARSAFSQSGSVLFFAPQRIDLSDKETIEEIRLTNTSDIARAYSLSMRNLIMNEQGITVLVDDFEYAAKRKVRFVPRQFDLDPGKTQIIRIMARISPDLPDGHYYSHLEFNENTERREEINQDVEGAAEIARMNAQLSYSAAIPVTVANGEIQTKVVMRDVEAKANEAGKRIVSMKIDREGNGHGRMYMDADYVAPDGSESQAASRRTVVAYRNLSWRNYSFEMDLLGDEVKEGSLRVRLYNRNISEEEPVQEIVVPLG